jgi:hypothetical protein
MDGNHVLKQGRNFITVKPGDSYSLSFDTDLSKVVSEKNAKIHSLEQWSDQLLKTLLKAGRENTWLKAILQEITGEWIDDPQDYYQNVLSKEDKSDHN